MSAIALRADQVQPGMKMWSSEWAGKGMTCQTVTGVYPSRMENVTVIDFDGNKVLYLSNSNVVALLNEETK